VGEKGDDELSRRALLGGFGAAAAGCGGETVRLPTAAIDTGDPVSGTGPTTPTSSTTSSSPTTPTTSTTTRQLPNVLILFPDQWRGQALSAAGDPNVATPMVDRLLAEGTWFTEAVTPSAVCTPARSALLTGWYPTRTGTSDNGDRLPSWAPTIAHWHRQIGYKTGYIGKWHLDGRTAGFGWVPLDSRGGFDDYWAASNFNHRYLSSVYYTDTPFPLRPDPPSLWEPIHQTNLAIDFIEAHRDEPWLLMLSYGPPHPNTPSPTQWSLDVPAALMAQIDPASLAFRDNVPDWIKVPNEGDPYGAAGFLQGYYACIQGLDTEIGRVLEALDALGLTEDTLVVFASDHGEMGGSHGLYKKGIYYDESVRVPLGFRWPGTLPAGQQLTVPATLCDVLPTIASLTGAGPLLSPHGRDLGPHLLFGDDTPAPSGAYLTRRQRGPAAYRVLRTSDHKLVRGTFAPAWDALFDLVSDPLETTNLIDNPDLQGVLADLDESLHWWRVFTDDPTV
jgi:arylsulfatase A-like enzyme